MCYYRDKNSINKFQIARVTTEGIDICEPFALETNWDLKVRGLHQRTNVPNNVEIKMGAHVRYQSN